MISDIQFLNARVAHTLAAVKLTGVDAGESSAQPGVKTDPSRADGSTPTLVRAEVVHSAQTNIASAARTELRGTIIEAAKEVVIKEILAILGKDIPAPRLHANWLRTLSLSSLHSRRAQLADEQLPRQRDLFGQTLTAETQRRGGQL